MPRKERSTGNGNVVAGSNGDDLISGIGGAYILSGGNGNDSYEVDGDDSVGEKNNGGTDLVRSWVDWSLGAHTENLTLLGSDDLDGTGNDAGNIITGNAGANRIDGAGGDDTLDGGDGDDTLIGGDGDDTLVGGGGDDELDGAGGIDIAVFGGSADDYSFARAGALLYVTGPSGTDILRDIEFLSFADRVIAEAEIGDAAPQAVDDLAAGAEGVAIVVSVLKNDLGNGLSVALATNGAKGVVTINEDDTVTYRPLDNASGRDSFTYTITDAIGRTSSATVAVDIAGVNAAPIAGDDSYSVTADQSFVSAAGLLANDSDPDGDALTISGYTATSAAGGRVQVSADGSFTYTPPAGFTGADSFRYTVTDGNGGSATATVGLNVEAAPTPEPPPEPDPSDPAEMPYYVAALLEDTYRFNYPDPYGTADSVTFTFLTEVPSYYSDAPWAHDGFRAFSVQQQEMTRAILDAVSGFANITFVEVSSAYDADITFGLANLGGTRAVVGSTADGVGTSGNDVWLDATMAGDTFVVGSEMYSYVLQHELGHVLGMDHITTGELPVGENNRQHSVMSANDPISLGTEPESYMLYDIATLQYIYGANPSTATGDDVYRFAELNSRLQTIWDGGGHDAIDLSASTFGVRIDLREGALSSVASRGQSTLAIAFGTVIEDATGGAFADTIMGNEADNRLTGGGGADVFGFAADWGNDVIADFASGEDIIDLSAAGLRFEELAMVSSGGDTVLSHGDASIVLEGVSSVSQADFMQA